MNKNIPFGLKYQEREKKATSPTGEKTQIEHTPHMGLDGKRVLKADNEKPIYEMIQAYREETEIERIVKRAMQGDISVLYAMEGQYMDLTGVPKSLAEAQQIIINAKRDFDKLDPEVRSKFNNNVEVFIAEAGSKEWCDKLGISDQIAKAEEAKKSEAEYTENMKKAVANLAKGKAKVEVVEEGAE